ncbi:MAG: response regulator [Euryarchaeota archaeon]|nr:response regulator [Euryarchaeota archaeon]
MTEQNHVRILHVEDNPRAIQLTQLYLEAQNSNFKITPVLSAGQALEKLETGNFDAVISDYAMPGMNGIEFLEEVRKKGNNIPFIILTGKGKEKEAIEALNKGADRYLKKEGDPTALFDTLIHYIQEVLEERRKEQELSQKTKELEAANQKLESTNREIEKLVVRANQMALEAEVANLELNQIFNTAVDGMCMIDKDFNVTQVNKTFSTLFGIGNDKAAGKKCFEVSNNPLCHTPNCPLKQIIGGEERVECEVEIEKERNDGIGIQCILTATPFMELDGELSGIIENFKDITERKHAEEALKHSIRLKESFLKETSHRISTPVSIIGGTSEVLLESSNLDEDQKARIRTIREKNAEIQQLVNDALAGNNLEEEGAG